MGRSNNAAAEAIVLYVLLAIIYVTIGVAVGYLIWGR